jgi:hypothetical protein
MFRFQCLLLALTFISAVSAKAFGLERKVERHTECQPIHSSGTISVFRAKNRAKSALKETLKNHAQVSCEEYHSGWHPICQEIKIHCDTPAINLEACVTCIATSYFYCSSKRSPSLGQFFGICA